MKQKLLTFLSLLLLYIVGVANAMADDAVSTPTVTIGSYDYEKGGYPVTPNCTTEGATLTYTLGSASAVSCTAGTPFYVKDGSLNVKATSGSASASLAKAVTINKAPSSTSPETSIPFQSTSDSYDKDVNHVYKSFTINKTYVAGINSSTSLKLRSGRTSITNIDGSTISNVLELTVNEGYTLNTIYLTDVISNRNGEIKITKVYVDGVEKSFSDLGRTDESLTIPASGGTALGEKAFKNVNATSSVIFVFELGTYTDKNNATQNVDQFKTAIKVEYTELNAVPEFKTNLPTEISATVYKATTLKVEANNATSYQWYKNTANSTDGATAIDGATEQSYDYTATEAGTEYFYCVATNKNGSTESKICAVTSVVGRTFVDFELNFCTDPYTVVTPTSGELPAGVTIDGTFYNTGHGYLNAVATVRVDGPVKISIGTCEYSKKDITIYNGDELLKTIKSQSLGCGNTAIFYYDKDEEATLTINLGTYCPSLKIELVDEVPALYTVTYVNGDDTSSDKVYSGLVLNLPADPQLDDDEVFVGWYSDSNEQATAATVVSKNITYNAIIEKVNIENGYVIVDNSGSNIENGFSLLAAIKYANANSSEENPVKIFLKNGTYDFANVCETALTGKYISFIGEDASKTIITTTPLSEGLNIADLFLNTGSNLYFQDLSLKNSYAYNNNNGRAASFHDKGTFTIMKNIKLLSYQDTYYSHKNNAYYYFEGGEIHGTVDYMCGQSNVFYEGVLLYNENRSSVTMTANSGVYVFNNCTVQNASTSTTYNFGRAWGKTGDVKPSCIYMNTTLLDGGKKMATDRWTLAGMNTTYLRAAEYGTKDANGNDITPSSTTKKFTYTKENVVLETAEFDIVLTSDEAETYSYDNFFASANWDPASICKQEKVSDVTYSDKTLSWTGSSDAYLIENENGFVALTASTSYPISESGNYTVRAANSRGGLGEASDAIPCGESFDVTLTYNIAVGESQTALSSTPTSTDARITMTGVSASANDATGKDGLTVKLNAGTADEAAATVTFTVPEGFEFVPTSASAKVQPVGPKGVENSSAMVKLSLTDASNTIENEAESFVSGSPTTSVLNNTNYVAFTGETTLNIYVYDNGTGVTTYRLGTPITITGTLQKIQEPYTVTVGETGFATIGFPKAVRLPKEVTGLVISKVEGSRVTLGKVAGGTAIAANTGMIIMTSKGDHTFEITKDGKKFDENKLVANSEGPKVSEYQGEFYVLAKLSEKTVGMAQIGNGVTLAQYKAYMPAAVLTENGEAKTSYSFVYDDNTTAVETVAAEEDTTERVVYNLAGQCVNKDTKGFIIVKGKKYLVK